MLNKAHTHLGFRQFVILFPNMNHHFAGAGHEVIVSCPVDDQSLAGEISSLVCKGEQDNEIIRSPFFGNGNTWGSPSAVEHAYT